MYYFIISDLTLLYFSKSTEAAGTSMHRDIKRLHQKLPPRIYYLILDIINFCHQCILVGIHLQ
ncbi:MAG: hypothetical protein ACTS85_04255 [Arsenophonus sp. NC-PG7-MAG3]